MTVRVMMGRLLGGLGLEELLLLLPGLLGLYGLRGGWSDFVHGEH